MRKIKKKNYWDYFYRKKNPPIAASPFAQFVFKRIRKKKFKVFDIGCGNGRDTIFFLKKKIDCTGVDKSKEVIHLNKRKFKFFKKKFLNYNFCNFFKKKLDQDFIVYSRFTWHTINYKSEKNLLKNLKTNKKLRYIFIEARSTKDDFYGKGKKIGKHEYVSSHYRRFIDAKDIIKKLSKFLKIIYFRESKNLAKFKKENPCVIRIIARPK